MADNDYAQEIWKTIPCASSYEVSDHGRIRRVAGGQGARPQIRKQDLERTGYLRVRLSEGGHRQRLSVHRLVASAFLGEPPTEAHQVAHYDNDKTNNAVGNLRWATCRENMIDKQRHETQVRGETNGRAKLSKADALYILGSQMRASELASMFSISRNAIYRIRNRETWAHL